MPSDIERLLDRLIRMQDMFFTGPKPDLRREEVAEGEGIVATLYISGQDGGNFKLKCEDGRAKWATDNDKSIHLITMNENTFLDLLDSSISMDQAFDLGLVTFHNAPGAPQDDWLYHMTKWKDVFGRLNTTLKYIVGGRR